jgi:hypothetical protein
MEDLQRGQDLGRLSISGNEIYPAILLRFADIRDMSVVPTDQDIHIVHRGSRNVQSILAFLRG